MVYRPTLVLWSWATLVVGEERESYLSLTHSKILLSPAQPNQTLPLLSTHLTGEKSTPTSTTSQWQCLPVTPPVTTSAQCFKQPSCLGLRASEPQSDLVNYKKCEPEAPSEAVNIPDDDSTPLTSHSVAA